VGLADEIAKLVQLHDSGQLTDDEFRAAKASLVSAEPTVPVPVAAHPAAPRTNTTAVVSLVTGIASMVLCPLLGIVGLIAGRDARRQIAASDGAEVGEGLATAGIVTSVIGLVVVGLVIGSIFAVTFLGQKASSKFKSVGSAVAGVVMPLGQG
jgi:hypothetical protein